MSITYHIFVSEFAADHGTYDSRTSEPLPRLLHLSRLSRWGHWMTNTPNDYRMCVTAPLDFRPPRRWCRRGVERWK